MMGMEHLGNRELLKQPKTAFLASGTIAPDVVLRCYDWATGEHEGCVVSGFSSRLEQDVLHFLLSYLDKRQAHASLCTLLPLCSAPLVSQRAWHLVARLSAIRLHGGGTRLHHPLGSAACLKQELRHQVPHGR